MYYRASNARMAVHGYYPTGQTAITFVVSPDARHTIEESFPTTQSRDYALFRLDMGPHGVVNPLLDEIRRPAKDGSLPGYFRELPPEEGED